MLKLNCKEGESIFILVDDKMIEVVALGNNGSHHQQLGVTAPPDVKVLRDESHYEDEGIF